jgi:hypothetical protein
VFDLGNWLHFIEKQSYWCHATWESRERLQESDWSLLNVTDITSTSAIQWLPEWCLCSEIVTSQQQSKTLPTSCQGAAPSQRLVLPTCDYHTTLTSSVPLGVVCPWTNLSPSLGWWASSVRCFEEPSILELPCLWFVGCVLITKEVGSRIRWGTLHAGWETAKHVCDLRFRMLSGLFVLAVSDMIHWEKHSIGSGTFLPKIHELNPVIIRKQQTNLNWGPVHRITGLDVSKMSMSWKPEIFQIKETWQLRKSRDFLCYKGLPWDGRWRLGKFWK